MRSFFHPLRCSVFALNVFLLIFSGCATKAPEVSATNPSEAHAGIKSPWTHAQARQIINWNDRVQQVGVRLNAAMRDEYSKAYRTLPFLTRPVLEKGFWEAYGITPVTGAIVTSVNHPEYLKDSRVRIGDEIISVEGEPVQSGLSLGKQLEKAARGKASLEMGFKRGNKTWKERIPVIRVTDEIHFHLIDNKKVYAFSVAGPHVFISTRMMKICKNDDELAFVLAHETAHIRLRHYKEKPWIGLGKSLVSAVAVGFVQAAANNKNPADAAPPADSELVKNADQLGEIAMSGFSKDEERDADKAALLYLHKAGFNLWRAVALWPRWMKLEKAEGRLENPYTHPAMEERYDYLLKQVALYRSGKMPESQITQSSLDPKDPAPGSLTPKLDDPGNALRSIFEALSRRDPEIFFQCITENFLKNEGISKEALRAEILGARPVPTDAYVILRATRKDNEVKIEYRVKKEYQDIPDIPGKPYAYFFLKTPEGWKACKRDKPGYYQKIRP